MSLLTWLKCRMFPSPLPEKEELAELIEKETERLNGAVHDLKREVLIVKKHRTEMAELFDDALRAMKEHK